MRGDIKDREEDTGVWTYMAPRDWWDVGTKQGCRKHEIMSFSRDIWSFKFLGHIEVEMSGS